MTEIDEEPTPYINRAITARVKDSENTAEQNTVRPAISNKNNNRVMIISRFVLSTECPTNNGINIEGNEHALSNNPNPAGVMMWSLIMYSPNTDNELLAKCPPNDILDKSNR